MDKGKYEQSVISDVALAPAKTAVRSSVAYHEFVFAYAARAALFLFLAFAGIAAILGAVMYLSGGWMVFFIATGLGMTGAGFGGLLAVLTAHNTYTRHLALNTTTTYQEPPKLQTIRPFVVSKNGQTSHTIYAGKVPIPLAVFERAKRKGGKLARDDAKDAGMAREYYYSWQDTLDELRQCGFLDEQGRITHQGWDMYRNLTAPSPNGSGVEPSALGQTDGRANGGREAIGEGNDEYFS